MSVKAQRVQFTLQFTGKFRNLVIKNHTADLINI